MYMEACTPVQPTAGTSEMNAHLVNFTSAIDWIVPMRLCWLSTRMAAWFILNRLRVDEVEISNLDQVDRYAENSFQALASYAYSSGGFKR